MDNRPSLDPLRRELVRRGLPAAYIQRYIEELNDHITDSIEERSNAMSTEAQCAADVQSQVGEPVRLAEFAAAQYRRANFWGRHPVLTCLVAPIPMVLLVWIAVFGLGIGAIAGVSELAGAGDAAADAASDDWPVAAVWASLVAFRVASILPPALVALLLCWLARRGGLSWRWPLAACLLVALAAGLFRGNLELPTAISRGTLLLGFGFGLGDWVQPLLQCLLPFAVAIAFAKWMARRSGAAPANDERQTDAAYRQAA